MFIDGKKYQIEFMQITAKCVRLLPIWWNIWYL